MSEPTGKLRQPVVVVLGHVDSGKCVSGDTLVQLADGRIETAEHLFESSKSGPAIPRPDGVAYRAKDLSLLSLSSGGMVESRPASHVWKLKSDRLVKVGTRAGYTLNTTPEHRFLVFSREGSIRYVDAQDLHIGDRLAVPRTAPVRQASTSEVRRRLLSRVSNNFLFKPDRELSGLIEGHCRKSGISKVGGRVDDPLLGFHLRKGYFRAETLRRLALDAGVPTSYLYDHLEQMKFASPKRRATHKSPWLKIPKGREELRAAYYLVGLLYGDGLAGTGHLSNTSPKLISKYTESLKISFGVGATSKWRRTSYIVSHRGGKTLSEFLCEAFEYPRQDKARSLSIPPTIGSAPDGMVAAFLKGFFDAEGWMEVRNNAGVSCESKDLMRRLPMLLQRFGCLAYFAKKRSRLELLISGAESLASFSTNVGFSEPMKSAALESALRKTQSNRVFDKTPLGGEYVSYMRKRYGTVGRKDFQLSYYESKKELTSSAVARLFSLSGKHQEIEVLRNLEAFRTVEVTSIEELSGNFDVYDFTVEENHNFLANCLVVHNTSLLDALRGTAVQAREVGGITQEIGASFFPLETLKQICGHLLDRAGGALEIPGLLMIDTPGHAVFSNLRLRGGSAADIAIVVVDVLKGLENQTLESIDILKQRKVPFLVALNKIDMIKGWKKGSSGALLNVLKEQPPEWNDELEERLYNVVGGMSRLSFQSDAYYRVKDFRQQVTIVPVSARTHVGIPELLSVLIGLSQQFLKGRLVLSERGAARGIILELQEEEGIGETANVILTEGELHVGDHITLVRRDGAFKSKVKALLMPKPLDEMRDPRNKFTPVASVHAAAGVKLVSPDLPGVVAGTSVASYKSESQFLALKSEMEKELSNIVVKTDNMGVIVKAGSVGGLEAVLRMLEERGIPVRQADIGDISKNDIVDAQVVGEHDPYLGAILGFDSRVLPEAKEHVGTSPIFVSSIIYEVIDNYANWAANKRDADEKAALSGLTRPCKLRAIPGNFFRRSDPAVFGVEILGGRLKPKVKLMNSAGHEVGTVEQIQDGGKPIQEAKKGDKVAISVDGPTLGRQVKEGEVLYSYPRSHEARALRTKLLGSLSEDENEALKEIMDIKSPSDPMYGF